jgi:hypothetical protein
MKVEKELEMQEVFKSWEEMSLLEQYACQYWDMYKDAYGVRPRGIDTSSWTEADFEAEFEVLGRAIEREEADRKEREAAAIIKFESIVGTLMTGNTTRAQAIQWLMDAESCNGDFEYFCFTQGLPYGYFKESA